MSELGKAGDERVHAQIGEGLVRHEARHDAARWRGQLGQRAKPDRVQIGATQVGKSCVRGDQRWIEAGKRGEVFCRWLRPRSRPST